MKRVLFRLLLVAAATLVLFEVALQVLSYAVHRKRIASAAATEVSAEDRTILCVGDSFTFGMGASDTVTMSYPGQLQTLLKEADQDWKVVNAGWPGRNSAQLIVRIDELFAKHNPEILVLMIGSNDSWSMPEKTAMKPSTSGSGQQSAPDSADSDKFRWEWRTARLFQTARERGSFKGDRTEMLANEHADVEPEDAQEEAPLVSATDGPEVTAWDHLRSGDVPKARAMFQAKLEGDRPVEGLIGMIGLHKMAGEFEQMAPLMAQLDQRIDAGFTEDETMQAVGGLSRLAMDEELVERFDGVEATYPDNLDMLFLVSNSYANLGQVEKAVKISDHFAGPTADQHHYGAWFYRVRSGLLEKVARHQEGAQCLIHAHTLDHNDAETLRSFGNRREIWLHLDFPDVLARAELEDQDRTDIGAMWEQFQASENQQSIPQGDAPVYATILKGHLATMIAHARDQGIEVVLSGYPFKEEPLHTPIRELAKEFDLPFIDNEADFASRVTSGSQQVADLYVADGHPTDFGYGLMAANILTALRERSWLDHLQSDMAE